MARLRPIGLLRSTVAGGIWAERRRVNRASTIPHGAAQLEAAGNLMNFRLAAGTGRGQYSAGFDDSGAPLPFLDSDVYKWLEAVGWELARGSDVELLALADPMIDLVAAAQRDDGYLDTYFQVVRPRSEFTDLAWGHELYTLGHLIQAAVAWLRSAGDDRLLKIASRAVKRVEDEMGPGRRELIDGHPEIEMALVELFRATGEQRHLELARTLLMRRGHGLLGAGRFGARYWQDHEPVRSAPDPVGHAVRQVYLDCGVVDVAVETGDRELLDAAIHRWEGMVESRTYLTGGLGSRHRDESLGDPFELPPDRAYGETCAAIGSVMLAWRLLLATGQSRFADLVERTAYNGVLSGLGRDGTHFFYSNPLQRRSGMGETLEGPATTRRAPWFSCACCPPNLMRFLATFPDLVATQDRDGIQVHQFAPGSVMASLDGGSARITVDTGYPWKGGLGLTVDESPATPWTLSIRVPGWCAGGVVTVDGVRTPVGPGPRTIELRRTWRPGDGATLELEMPPRATAPDPRIDAVRGSIALERGPLVYAVEEQDLPEGVGLESIEVEREPELSVSAAKEDSRLGDVRTLSLEAFSRPDDGGEPWPYRATPNEGRDTTGTERQRIAIQAIPYFAWGNRSGTGMRVWLPTRPEPALEPRARGESTGRDDNRGVEPTAGREDHP